LCVATLVVHALPDMPKFFQKAFELLKNDGMLFIAIPHPCFWPMSKSFFSDTFEYRREIMHEIPFKIKTNKIYDLPISYYHRPISIYLNQGIENGFILKSLDELYENFADEENYSLPPHLLGVCFVKH
jgi:hypothetical protein